MKLVCNKENYDDFLTTRFVSGNFLQSSVWRNFLSRQGKRYWQAAVLEEDKLIGLCLLYENKLPFDRTYLYSPKGPVISQGISEEKRKDVLRFILSQAREITIETKKKEEIFFKLEPENSNLILPELQKCPDVQPRDTWILDIKDEEKKLLANMHTKTRYNIALAKKKGVSVFFSQDEKDIEIFLALNRKTADRKEIKIHDDDYYRLLFKTLLDHKVAHLAIATVNGQPVAANILIYFGQAMTYLHGASDYEFRNYMAPHLLQWESIKKAKTLGAEIYDFWGIAPEDGSKPKWVGISRFKKGFGGQVVYSPGAYNLIYNNSWYSIYKLAKIILRK
ncbi:peptidoglycan bridge formation glycyltransferase FemA/FemB family protein [Patescibacteria group bacterium]|nr:peptidoglycan bridge formation glycyltransferase FemA/FemB family protein [Patescibacteria group bacterium]